MQDEWWGWARKAPGEPRRYTVETLARSALAAGAARRASAPPAAARESLTADSPRRHEVTARSAASASTACAACSPWSRLPPPVRASACSMFSTVSTPNAQGTPVASWTSWIPRAASAQT